MEKFHIYAIIAGVLLVGSFVLPAATTVHSEAQIADSEKLPAPLSATEEEELLNLVLSNNIVQEKLKERNYDFVGVGFFTENIDVDQPVWKPVVHLNVKQVESLAIFLDATKQNVEKIERLPYKKLSHDNAVFASNYYTGVSTVNGLRFAASAPTYSTTDGTTNSLTALLLNGVAANSDMDFLCDPGHYPSTYWAQTGFAWTTTIEAVVWTDTAAGCSVQSTGMSYTENDDYEFKIYVSGTTWYIFAKNLDSGASYTKTRTTVTYLTMKTSEFNTGVFFENQNTGTNWYNKYSSTSLSASGAKISTNGGSTWSNWQSGAKQDQKCDHTRQSSTVISNNLSSGGSATWNLQTMSGIHC